MSVEKNPNFLFGVQWCLYDYLTYSIIDAGLNHFSVFC